MSKTNARDERNFHNKSGRKDTKHRVNRVKATISDSDGDVGLTVTYHELNSVGVTGTDCSDCWIVDSGARCNICHERELFTCFKTLKVEQEVTLGDGRSLQATGSGTVELELVLPNGEPKTTLHDVLYVPGLSYTLLSVAKMIDRGRKISFYKSWCQVADNRKRVVACAKKKGGLYQLFFTHSSHHLVNMVESKETLWHRRLRQLDEKNLKQMACEDLVLGFNYDVSKSVGFCESCVNGKIHRCHFPTTGHRRGEEPLSIVHSDVCRKVNMKSLGGAEYFLTFIDDNTHFTWVYVLKHKYEVFQQFLKWKAMVEKSSGYKLKA